MNTKVKKNGNMFGFLQKFGQSLLVPVALLPITGLMYGFGIALSSENMLSLAPWLGDGVWPMIAKLLSNSGSIVFSNLALIFSVGVAIGLADNHDGSAGLAAVGGYLLMNQTINTLLSLNAEKVAENTAMYQSVLGTFTLRTGVFGGIFVGLLAAWAYNRYHTIELPSYLAFFSAKRFVPIVTALGALILGAVLCIIWPPIQSALLTFSYYMLEANPIIGMFLYGVIVKGLNPLGLHTAFYTPFYYQFGEYLNLAGELITGDKAIFFAQMADGVKVTGGIFNNGAFVMEMIGCFGGALAIYRRAKPDKKRMAAGVMMSACVTSFLTGISEPFLFSFLFVAPVCFGAYCILNGLAYVVCYLLDIHVVSGFASGIIDYILIDVLSGAPRWYLIIPVGLVFAVLLYLAFYFIIPVFDYKTPGREDDDLNIVSTGDGEMEKVNTKNTHAKEIVEALGGKDNIKSVTCCATRLRVTVLDEVCVQEKELKQIGAKGLLHKGKNFQIIIGLGVQSTLRDVEEVLKG